MSSKSGYVPVTVSNAGIMTMDISGSTSGEIGGEATISHKLLWEANTESLENSGFTGQGWFLGDGDTIAQMYCPLYDWLSTQTDFTDQYIQDHGGNKNDAFTFYIIENKLPNLDAALKDWPSENKFLFLVSKGFGYDPDTQTFSSPCVETSTTIG